MTTPVGAMRRALTLAGAAIVATALAGCTGGASPSPAAPSASTAASPEATAMATPAGSKDLILATTTSTQDSGLLDVLVPAFEEATGYKVKTVAVGSGAALKLGEEGNADVLLVHSPGRREGRSWTPACGVDRRLVMHNSFLVVGPSADPAGIKGMTSAAGRVHGDRRRRVHLRLAR